jgi:hypothetical protein
MREGAGNGSRSRTARAGRPVSWIDDLYEPALREQQGGYDAPGRTLVLSLVELMLDPHAHVPRPLHLSQALSVLRLFRPCL